MPALSIRLSSVCHDPREVPMLANVIVGVRDMKRATEFYDAVFGALGYKRVSTGEKFTTRYLKKGSVVAVAGMVSVGTTGL